MPGETTIVARGTVSHTLRHDATNKTGCALQAGKMLGVLYACMGLIFLPIFALAGLAGAFAQQTQQAQNTGGPPAALIRRDDVRIRNLHARFLGRVWLYLRRYFRRYLQPHCPLDRRH